MDKTTKLDIGSTNDSLNLSNSDLNYILTILEVLKDDLDTDKSVIWRLINYGNNLFLSEIVPNLDKLKNMELENSIKILKDKLISWGYIK